MLNNKSILITGGTGTFGKAFIKEIIKTYKIKRLLYLVEMNSNNMKWQNFSIIEISFIRFFRRCKR